MSFGTGLRLLAAAVLVSAGCQKTAPSPVAAGDPGPIAVQTTTTKIQPVHWSIELPGTVMPFEATPLVAKLAGYVKTIGPDPKQRQGVIDIGSEVKAGQLLATIDIPEQVEEVGTKKALVAQAAADAERARRDLEVAESLIALAESMVEEAKAGVPRAEADLERWKSELVRSEDLVARKVIDQQNRDEIHRQHLSAQATLQEVNAKVASARAALAQRRAQRNRDQADLHTAEAKIKVAEAAWRKEQALLQYTEVRAPFDGIVTARNVDPGHFLQPGASHPGRPLFIVARRDLVRIFIEVPEAAAEKASEGARAVVRVPALGDRLYGETDADAVTVTRTTGVIQPDSRTLRAEIDIDNKTHDKPILPGMYVFVQIRAESAGAMVLPASAVLPADETHYCFLVEGGKAVKHRVRVGRVDGGTIQVLDHRKATAVGGKWVPFTGAEQIVAGNLGALADGMAVQAAKP